jgi:hypothetical protein
MALTHMAKLLQATDFLPISSISNSGLFVTCLSFFRIASLSARACLSYYRSLSRKPRSVMTFLAPSQSLFSPSRMQTASKTILTASGGLENPFISVISALLSFFRASAAALRAGMAFPSST